MPAGATTLADIADADWSLQLDFTTQSGAFGSGYGNVARGLADVDQCIRIICTTPKGADPLRPTFGADIWKYIDFPINSAIPSIVREITDAITLWEPRVKLLSITGAPIVTGGQAGAQMLLTIEWELALESAIAISRTTTLSLGPLNQVTTGQSAGNF